MVPAATSTAPATGVLPVRVDLPTTFLPLSTAWPNNPKCSSYIYQGLYSSLIAFDPIYGRDIDSAAADCLPPEAISWWWWKDEDPAAVTSLGYDFTCPEAYYTATKIGADAMRTQIFCCPLQYKLLQPLTEALYYATGAGTHVFASQCLSTLAPGGVVTYQHLDGSYLLKSKTAAESETISVFALPVNGWVTTAATTVPQGSSLSLSTTSTESMPLTTTQASTMGARPADGRNNTMIFGTIAGSVIGGFLLLSLLFLLWYHRWRKGQRIGAQSDAYDKPQLHSECISRPIHYELEVPPPELEGPKIFRELSGDGTFPPVRELEDTDHNAKRPGTVGKDPD